MAFALVLLERCETHDRASTSTDFDHDFRLFFAYHRMENEAVEARNQWRRELLSICGKDVACVAKLLFQIPIYALAIIDFVEYLTIELIDFWNWRVEVDGSDVKPQESFEVFRIPRQQMSDQFFRLERCHYLLNFLAGFSKHGHSLYIGEGIVKLLGMIVSLVQSHATFCAIDSSSSQSS